MWGLWASCALIDPVPQANVLEDLSVVAVILEPPEVSPGESVQVEVHAADPLGAGIDLLVWSCTPFEGRCVESLFGARPILDRSVGDLPWSGAFEVPQAAALLLDPAVDTSLLVYTLACEPGLCPIVAAADAALVSDDLTDLYPQLFAPQDWLAQLPFEGVYLAVRRLVVSRDTTREARNDNPILQSTPVLPATASPSQSFGLEFRISDPQDDGIWAYGLTTGGTISTRVPVQQGDVRLDFVAPAGGAVEQVDMWVVFEEDVANGAALYHHLWEIR